MNRLKGVVGFLLALAGVVWLGQGFGLIPGSFMSGQILWAAIGLLCLVVGGWLLSTAFRPSGSARARL